MQRNSVIYGISFGGVALFLLILMGALYIPTRNQVRKYDQETIKIVSLEANYLEHVSVADKVIKRLIMVSAPVLASQEGLLEASLEQERVVNHYYAIVVLLVRGYGSPTQIIAKYETNGKLVDINWQERQPSKQQLLSQLRSTLEQQEYALDSSAIAMYSTDMLPLVRALQHAGTYVQQVVEV